MTVMSVIQIMSTCLLFSWSDLQVIGICNRYVNIIQWEYEYQIVLVFKCMRAVQLSNGQLFKWWLVFSSYPKEAKQLLNGC